MEELGHDIDPRRRVIELSLAQRQLIEIARALAFRSRLIIMDEPTAPLTGKDAEGLFRTIRTLRDRGVSVIYISHRLREIFEVTDRVTVMRDGRRVFTRDTAAHHAGRAGARHGRRGPEGAAPDAARARRQPEQEEALRIEGALNLTVRRGEVVGLAGLAGAGRTELLEWLFGAVARLRQPRRRQWPPGDHPQSAGRHPAGHGTGARRSQGQRPRARRVVMRQHRAARPPRPPLPRSADERRSAGQLMGELRIRAVSLDQPLRYLSGGNQQKAVLAKWLSAGSDIFLLDEPTRGVDVRSKAEIYDIIRALCARGCAVLLASSELEELLALSDRILVMHRGHDRGRVVARRSHRRRNHEAGDRGSALKRVPQGDRVAAVRPAARAGDPVRHAGHPLRSFPDVRQPDQRLPPVRRQRAGLARPIAGDHHRGNRPFGGLDHGPLAACWRRCC